MDTNMFDKFKETTIDGLKFFVTHRVRPPVQRLFRCLTVSFSSLLPLNQVTLNGSGLNIPACRSSATKPSAPTRAIRKTSTLLTFPHTTSTTSVRAIAPPTKKKQPAQANQRECQRSKPWKTGYTHGWKESRRRTN